MAEPVDSDNHQKSRLTTRYAQKLAVVHRLSVDNRILETGYPQAKILHFHMSWTLD